jgi:excisionase family DNA binding protein
MDCDEALIELQRQIGLVSDQIPVVRSVLEQLVPNVLSVQQAAVRLGCGRDTIIRAIRAGRLPAYNVGQGAEQSFRIKHTDLEQLRFRLPQVNPSPVRNRRRSSYKPKRLRLPSVE